MTPENNFEFKKDSVPQVRRELALAGVLLLLTISLTAGFTCAVLFHFTAGIVSNGWHWKKNAPEKLDTVAGDETDKGDVCTFNKLDLAELNDSLHLLSATQAMLKMDYGRALEEIEKINATYRKADSSCRTLEVECRLSLKQSNEVIAIATDAIASNPKDYAGWLWRAQAYEQLKEYNKAIVDYRKALEVSPDSKRALSSQLPPAFVEKIVQGLTAMVYRRIGACFERLGDYKEASAQYLAAIKINSPLLVKSIEKKVTAVIAQKNLADLNRTIAARPNDNSLYFMRGRAYKNLGKYKEALADFNRAIEPGAPVDFFMERAAVCFALADYKSSARDLRKAHVDDPLYEMAHMRQRKYSSAVMPVTGVKKSRVLTRLDRVIQQNPDVAENYYHRGILQMAFHQYDDGARDLEHFLSLKTGVNSVPVAKANIYLALCRGLDRRRTEYEILLSKSREKYSNFKWWQAVMLYLEGKGVTETALLESAKNNKARLVQAHYYIGQRLAIEGLKEKAQTHFEAGVAVGEEFVDESYLCKLALIPDPDSEKSGN